MKTEKAWCINCNKPIDIGDSKFCCKKCEEEHQSNIKKNNNRSSVKQ